MTIRQKSNGQFTIKSKQATIEIGPEIKIGERTISGPGEYEIAGVQVEGLPNGIFLLRVEDTFLLYLDRLSRPLTDDELDQVNLADILFVPVGGAQSGVDDVTVLTPEQAVAVINQVDPRIVIPTYYASLEPFRQAEGKPLEMMQEFKVTKATLPIEERQVIVLE